MKLTSLTALSPLDGRYRNLVEELNHIFSEHGLIHHRLIVEIKWLHALSNEPKIKEIPKFDNETLNFLDDIINDFSEKDAEHIKDIESKIKHDTKAVEYFLKEKISSNPKLVKIKEFVHFACTSEDINNLAYGLMLKDALCNCIFPNMNSIITALRKLAHQYAKQPMLARTHGQPASSTTVGKEFANFVGRLQHVYEHLKKIQLYGKANGATGNFNAHTFVYPDVNWRKLTKKFITDLGLSHNEYTTQIEPHDNVVALCNGIMHFNSILLNLTQDIWGYFAIGYFQLTAVANEVGSSVMPHKVNPIDFENSEGNLGLANAILGHFSGKLPISRWQRDLSDSTVLRNLGSGLGYALLSYKMFERGIKKLNVNSQNLSADLENHYEILAEAVQTTMRRYGIDEPYEKLKALTRGKKVTKKTLHDFIKKSELPSAVKEQLLKLTPLNYLGKSQELAKEI